MPAKITVYTDFLSPRISFIPAHAPDIHSEVFKTVFSALQNNDIIKFEYRAVSKTTSIQFTVNPYHAVYHLGTWYMIGYCHYNKIPLTTTQIHEVLQRMLWEHGYGYKPSRVN
jgi:hypothetical protein